MAARLPYRLTEPPGRRACIGLIALQADETVEPDLRRMIRSDAVALYVTRIPSGADLTPASLSAMEAALPAAAALLPPTARFDAVAYACTSGAMLIGPDRVAALVRGAARTGAVAEPLTAIAAALAALSVRRIALITPYVEAVSAPLRAALAARGARIAAFGSFEEPVEGRVARIDPASIGDAARRLGRREDVEAVVISCTNLRTLDVIDAVEADIGKPVIASNQALAWRLAGLSGIADLIEGPGRLLRLAR